ncbi:hypothetical protein GRI38_10675 [Altererythrobacter aurantiacus]|uniref:Uncharacterized protein n=1 Tax=Parapontixanthobacter aurantiacus TaxID=1463599 RepID=A0A844ZFD7_9SPHN|nr:hypothetical protein [Parapontixanthobacter aurantiacus]MXO86488.1 hypothetical protein [Parapontixanthobacter aurantiacus]
MDDSTLTKLAILTIEDAARSAISGPVNRTFGVRLALAYLASRYNCERWPFDWFWRFLPEGERKGRTANLTGALNAIYRQIGIDKRAETIAAEVE